VLVSEIDAFWNDVPVEPCNLEIDSENLNSIAIYLALESQLSVLLIDILFIENFVSKAIMFTNRAYYMTVLHSAM